MQIKGLSPPAGDLVLHGFSRHRLPLWGPGLPESPLLVEQIQNLTQPNDKPEVYPSLLHLGSLALSWQAP